MTSSSGINVRVLIVSVVFPNPSGDGTWGPWPRILRQDVVAGPLQPGWLRENKHSASDKLLVRGHCWCTPRGRTVSPSRRARPKLLPLGKVGAIPTAALFLLRAVRNANPFPLGIIGAPLVDPMFLLCAMCDATYSLNGTVGATLVDALSHTSILSLLECA